MENSCKPPTPTHREGRGEPIPMVQGGEGGHPRVRLQKKCIVYKNTRNSNWLFACGVYPAFPNPVLSVCFPDLSGVIIGIVYKSKFMPISTINSRLWYFNAVKLSSIQQAPIIKIYKVENSWNWRNQRKINDKCKFFFKTGQVKN